jgi:hypothetical protein
LRDHFLISQIQEESRHIYDFAALYKDSLVRALSAGSEQVDLPTPDVLKENFARLDQLHFGLNDIAALQSVLPAYRTQAFVKTEEDSRMHDVASNSSDYYSEGSAYSHQPMHQDGYSRNESHWGPPTAGPQDGAWNRSKYKKRSVSDPPSPVAHCRREPLHLVGVIIVKQRILPNGGVAQMEQERCAMPAGYVSSIYRARTNCRLGKAFQERPGNSKSAGGKRISGGCHGISTNTIRAKNQSSFGVYPFED